MFIAAAALHRTELRMIIEMDAQQPLSPSHQATISPTSKLPCFIKAPNHRNCPLNGRSSIIEECLSNLERRSRLRWQQQERDISGDLCWTWRVGVLHE